jgi:hypothetical protein
MSFDLCYHPLKIWDSIKTPIPKMGIHLGVWGFILAFSYTPESMKCESQASFLAHTFASPCLGHKPNVRVMTILLFSSNSNGNPFANSSILVVLMV